MKFRVRTAEIFISAVLLIISTVNTKAFALLGPPQPWMQATNFVFVPGDIGGPMPIGCGYRWNVPVVTYGFDQSFLNYFGSNGVAAVESAIEVLNSLPPASQIDLNSYPLLSKQVNYQAQAEQLLDLKSATLTLLLEHIGLASPTRYIYTLKQWEPAASSFPSTNVLFTEIPGTSLTNDILTLNFDPETLNATPYVNGALYSANEVDFKNQHNLIPLEVYVGFSAYNAVADGISGMYFVYNGEGQRSLAGVTPAYGCFYSGLTSDDVGGLAYLMSSNNANFEYVIPGVLGTGTNSSSFVNGAWRPGVEKLTLLAQPVDPQSGSWLPTTNYFTDTYITNGISVQQQMTRVISRPDFLFSAGDTQGPGLTCYTRSGTTNWINNSVENGNSNGVGPGTIVPPVHVIFDKLGRYLTSGYGENQATDESYIWGSFDGSTNPPVVYPVPQTGSTQSILRMGILVDGAFQVFNWNAGGTYGAQYALQTSTDWSTWTTLFTITNNGTVNWYEDNFPTSSSRFYRLVPQ